MMDWTDRHCRFFHRLLTRRALLYTEMVTTGALLHGDLPRHLDYDAAEHPLALQVGGCEPGELAQAARLAEQWGYDEVNLNCGCPSDRVQRGAFGACLMAEPERVRDGLRAMREACGIEVTIKHRLGLGRDESYQRLRDFVGTVADSGVRRFIVHARNAWLEGLSPKDNREVPPLRYAEVHRLRQDFPSLLFVLNGGLQDLDACLAHLKGEEDADGLDGVMLGRAAYQQPWLLSEVDARIYGVQRDAQQSMPDRWSIAQRLSHYAAGQIARGVPLRSVARHALGLFNGLPGARRWRRMLSDDRMLAHADAGLILRAADEVRPADWARAA